MTVGRQLIRVIFKNGCTYVQPFFFLAVLLDTFFDRIDLRNTGIVAVKKSGQKNYHVGGRDFSK